MGLKDIIDAKFIYGDTLLDSDENKAQSSLLDLSSKYAKNTNSWPQDLSESTHESPDVKADSRGVKCASTGGAIDLSRKDSDNMQWQGRASSDRRMERIAEKDEEKHVEKDLFPPKML